VRPGVDPLETVAPFRGYRFEIRIDDDKSLHLELLTGYEYEEMNNGLLKKALTEYVAMQTPRPRQKPVGPEVIIRPDVTLDLKTVTDVARTVRVAESAVVRIVVLDGPDLDVSTDPKFPKPTPVRPNPLFLLVRLGENGSITLNKETVGSLSDLSPLEMRLKTIFDDRGINGEFREGTYDIEKTVHITALPEAKFADVIAVAKAVEAAGSSSITLQVDPIDVPTVRDLKEILK
jgi:biopolymer transport protein ExbD